MSLFNVPELPPCEFLDIKVIGRGSFGQIHAMLHVPTSEVVAVKRMSKRACLARPSHLKALSVELSILAKTDSRFLLRLKSVILTPDELCFVLPYFPGGDLTRHFESIETRFGSVSPAWIEFYAAEVVLALADLHAMKVVHRDVKPENVLVTRDGHLMLCDFGIAHQLLPKDRYKTKGKIGNGPFVAPEIANGKGWYSCDADLYSLGVFLIWMFERHANVPRFQAKVNNAVTPRVARTLIDKLVERDYHRLSMKQVQSHLFFANTNWEALRLGHISPPVDADMRSLWHQNPYLVPLNSDQTALPDFIGSPETHLLGQSRTIDFFGLLDVQGPAQGQYQSKVELREAPLTEQQQGTFLHAISFPSAPTLRRCVSDDTNSSLPSLDTPMSTPSGSHFLPTPSESNMSIPSGLSTPSGLSELILSFPKKSGDVMFSSSLPSNSSDCSQPTPSSKRRQPPKFRYPLWRSPPSRSPSPPRDFDDSMDF